ncbi:MAG: outer membrane beta-barrel protein, partial [Bacteroidota bacterium]
MVKHVVLGFILTIIFTVTLDGQGKHPANASGDGPGKKGGVIKVKVVDQSTSGIIEYANIVVYSEKDSSLVTGGITDENGEAFIRPLPFGKYYVEVDFIGYIKQRKTGIEVSESKRFVDLGTIKLPQAAEVLEDVQVEADRKHIDYKIDKKVINVSQDISSVGGSAVDILENTPSIQTDIEGNVQLRGSSSFTVLIDGKPTPLDGSEALQQIPASSIENIEIITNPSAKFDPDGTAGIINIIMKEEEKQGINGNFNLSYGSFNAVNGDFLVNARTGKFNFFVGGNYNDRIRKSTSDNLRATIGDSTLVTSTSGESDMGHKGYNVRTGLDYYLTDNDIFTVSGEYGTRGFERSMISEYDQYYTDAQETPFTDENAAHTYYLMDNGFEVLSKYLSTDLNYQRKFNDSGHELQAYVYYSLRESDQNSGFEKTYTDAAYNVIEDSAMTKERSDENGENSRWRTKIDYTLPFSENGKFEAGYQLRGRKGLSDYEYRIWDKDKGSFVPDNSQFNDVEFNRQIHSAYSTYTNQLGKFDFMLGVRSEYTDRIFTSKILNDEWHYNKFDFFPSAHVSRKMPYDIKLQASYTRRIRRPRSWFLDPFKGKMDDNIYRVGNPGLEPA